MASTSFSCCLNSELKVTEKRGVIALTSIASSWNYMLKLFNSPIFSQSLHIISFMFFTWIHAWNNHAHRFGFIIDIWKSILGFSPFLIGFWLLSRSKNEIISWMHVWTGVVRWHQRVEVRQCSLLEWKWHTFFDTSTSSNPKILCFCELTNNQLVKPSFALPVKQIFPLELFDKAWGCVEQTLEWFPN
jgi:hypothetical protein